jgi:hypothetical protein
MRRLRESMSRTLLSLAGFQVILSGRFWVIAEGDQSGDAGRDGWNHAFAGQPFHEPIEVPLSTCTIRVPCCCAAGAAVPAAACLLHFSSGSPAAGAPDPASAEVAAFLGGQVG